jgi:hypothetical protein
MNLGLEHPARRIAQRLARTLWLVGALSLAACGGGGSDPPPDPTPAGEPVTQTVGTAGGTVQAATLGGKVRLVFPAGAVASDTAVTITPVTPASGDVLSVKLRPAGVSFAKPVTVVLEYPAGSTPQATSRLRLQLGASGVFLPTTVDTTARTLSTTLDTFGGARIDALGAPGAQRMHSLAAHALDSPPDDSTLSAQQISSVAQSVANARQRLADLQASGQYEAALALQLSIADLVMRTGEDGYSADATPFLDGAHDTACLARNTAIATAQAAPINAPGDFRPLAAKILYWETVVQRLGGTPCSGIASIDAVHELVLRELAFLRARFPAAATPAEFGPPAGDVKDARTIKAEARQLQATDPSSPPMAQSVRARPQSIAVGGIATALQTELIDPAMEPARNAAWTAARAGGALGQYPVLVQAFGTAGPLAQDAQYVRTRIAVASSDSSGNPVDSATLGFASVPTLPADPVRSAMVAVRSGGTLALSGNVATLECAAAGTETLQVTFENVPVRSATGSSGILLAGALASLTPAGLLQAAGLPADDTGIHPLVVRRTSPCSAALGITDEVIGTVMVDFGAAVIRFSVEHLQVAFFHGNPTTCSMRVEPTETLQVPFHYVPTLPPCGAAIFSAAVQGSYPDARTFALTIDIDAIDDVVELTFGGVISISAAGTLTVTANPAWVQSGACPSATAQVSHYVEFYRVNGTTTGPKTYVGFNYCPYLGINGRFETSARTIAVEAGDQVQFWTGVLNWATAPPTSMSARGAAVTVHFDPTP